MIMSLDFKVNDKVFFFGGYLGIVIETHACYHGMANIISSRGSCWVSFGEMLKVEDYSEDMPLHKALTRRVNGQLVNVIESK